MSEAVEKLGQHADHWIRRRTDVSLLKQTVDSLNFRDVRNVSARRSVDFSSLGG